MSTTTKSEREKMLAGELYAAWDPELVEERTRARELVTIYNISKYNDSAGRAEILKKLLGSCGDGVFIETPFYCDYVSID